MADYYTVLANCVAKLPSDLDARRDAYNLARRALVQRLRAVHPPLSEATIGAEHQALEIAIRRVESEVAQAAARDAIAWRDDPPPEQIRTRSQPPRAVLWAASFCVALLLATAGYQAYRATRPKMPDQAPRATASRLVEFDDRQLTAADAAPTPISYIFLRQMVYYRSTHPTGTVVIDKAQRLLYLIRAETTAVRYGIGVGRDCMEISGLLKVSQKDLEPVWRAATSQETNAISIYRTAAQQVSPLGARAIHLGNDVRLIHGTIVTKSIGRSVWLGCFRLIDRDVIELYERLPIGSRVVVTN